MDELEDEVGLQTFKKRDVAFGLFVSFLLFCLSLFINLAFSFTQIGKVFGFVLSYVLPVFFYYSLWDILSFVIYLILNQIVYSTSNNTGFKRGVKYGRVFSIIFILLILFRFFTYFDASNRIKSLDEAINNGDVSYCKKLDNLFDRNKCVLSIALEEEDANLCKDIIVDDKEQEPYHSRGFRETCYKMIIELAKSENNAFQCATISDTSLYNDCLFELAKENNNPTACVKLENSSSLDSCYFYSVQYSYDVNLIKRTCDLIKTESYKKQCQALLNPWKTYYFKNQVFSFPSDWKIEESLPDYYPSLTAKPLFSNFEDDIIVINIPCLSGGKCGTVGSVPIFTKSKNKIVLKVFDLIIEKAK